LRHPATTWDRALLCTARRWEHASEPDGGHNRWLGHKPYMERRKFQICVLLPAQLYCCAPVCLGCRCVPCRAVPLRAPLCFCACFCAAACAAVLLCCCMPGGVQSPPPFHSRVQRAAMTASGSSALPADCMFDGCMCGCVCVQDGVQGVKRKLDLELHAAKGRCAELEAAAARGEQLEARLAAAGQEAAAARQQLAEVSELYKGARAERDSLQADLVRMGPHSSTL
jgi:hypothetical protein